MWEEQEERMKKGERDKESGREKNKLQESHRRQTQVAQIIFVAFYRHT